MRSRHGQQRKLVFRKEQCTVHTIKYSIKSIPSMCCSYSQDVAALYIVSDDRHANIMYTIL